MSSGDPQNKQVGRFGDLMVRGASGWGPLSVAAVFLAFAALFKDSLFRIVGSGNSTKRLAFEVDTQAVNLTTTIDVGAQTGSRTFLLPVTAGNDTLAVLGTAQTFTGAQTFNAATICNDIITISKPVAGSMTTGQTNSNNGTTSQSTLAVLNDAAVSNVLRAYSSGSTQTLLGITLANYTSVIGTTASVAGMIIGPTGSNSAPLVFGIGSTEAARLSATNRNLLLASATDDGIHKLQVTGKTRHAGESPGTSTTATAAGTTTLTISSNEMQQFTGTLGQTINFPAANAAGAGFAVYFCIINLSTAAVTPTRAGSDTFVGGGTTSPVAAGVTQWFASDGVSVWRLV